MANANKPANIDEEHSETPWLTSQAIEFMEQAKGPWCAHVSYIKPHWPYIVPPPYHDMYGVDDIQPVVRSDAERKDPHPVFGAFMDGRVGKTFARDEVRDTVIPAYMGLIKQCDDQMGRLLKYLEDTEQLDSTMIILTSDHGDYLGDHWMGEKDLFHAPSVKVPLIIYDPRTTASETRGTTCDALVESIDLTATIIDASGGDVPDHIVEGHSLMPYIEARKPDNARTFAISEYDYSLHPVCSALGTPPRDARLFMVATHDWKLIHAEGGFPPMLFDLKNDPNELHDLGRDPVYAAQRATLYEHLHAWGLRMSQRITMSDNDIIQRRENGADTGVILGVYDEKDIPAHEVSSYVGKTPPRS